MYRTTIQIERESTDHLLMILAEVRGKLEGNEVPHFAITGLEAFIYDVSNELGTRLL